MNTIPRIRFPLFLSLLVITGLFSCDDEPVEYPVTYTSQRISGIDYRIYAGSGEITDTDTKDHLIAGYDDYLNYLETLDVKGKIEATYISGDSVKITVEGRSEIKARKVAEKDGLIYWERQDTVNLPVSPGFDINSILRHQPLFFVVHDVPIMTGYEKFVEFKPCNFLFSSHGKLKFPVIDYIQWSDTYSRVFAGLNNEFNEDYLSTLDISDTVIVRTYIIEIE